jgi:hypothetical protein
MRISAALDPASQRMTTLYTTNKKGGVTSNSTILLTRIFGNSRRSPIVVISYVTIKPPTYLDSDTKFQWLANGYPPAAVIERETTIATNIRLRVNTCILQVKNI